MQTQQPVRLLQTGTSRQVEQISVPSRRQWIPFLKPSRGTLTAVLLTIIWTVINTVWLSYHYITQPAWLQNLPSLLDELLLLLEAAALMTLIVLWGILIWRRFTRVEKKLIALTHEEQLDLSPLEFEQYVASLFAARGYDVKLRGKTGDLGVDVELASSSGKRAIVQCKRYNRNVGPEIVRELYGTLLHEKAAHAFLVTTATISKSAHEWAENKPLTLIDGDTLARIALAVSESLENR